METQEKVIEMTEDKKLLSRAMTLLKTYTNQKNEKNFRRLYQFIDEWYFGMSDEARGVISKKIVDLSMISGQDINLWNLAVSFGMGMEC